MNRSRMRGAGFTLIEVVASIALGGLTIAVAVALYIAVVQGWRIAESRAAADTEWQAVRLLLQTGLSFANEQPSEEDPFGIATPGNRPREDPAFYFLAHGSHFAQPRLGQVTCFLILDDDKRISLLLEPQTLTEDNGDSALLHLPLLPGYQGIYYWFYNDTDDTWEEVDDVEDFGNDLSYLGNPLNMIELRPEEETAPVIWLLVPLLEGLAASDDPGPSDQPGDEETGVTPEGGPAVDPGTLPPELSGDGPAPTLQPIPGTDQ